MADTKTNSLSRGDLQFLTATSAREESGLREVVTALAQWNYEEVELTDVLLEFLHLGEIGVTTVTDGKFNDCDIEQAKTAIETMHEQTDWWSPLIYLTEKGTSRYEIDDWGITTARAKYLVFSSQANAKSSTDA